MAADRLILRMLMSSPEGCVRTVTVRHAGGWYLRMELFGGKVAGLRAIGLADSAVAAIETRAVPSTTQTTWVAAWVTWELGLRAAPHSLSLTRSLYLRADAFSAVVS